MLQVDDRFGNALPQVNLSFHLLDVISVLLTVITKTDEGGGTSTPSGLSNQFSHVLLGVSSLKSLCR